MAPTTTPRRGRRRIPTDDTTPPPTLTVEEAARIAHVCRRTVGRWIDDDRFRSARPIAAGSGRRLIDRASFLAFLGVGSEAG